MIRLGLVCDHLGLGGQEVAMLDLLERLDRSRFEPFVYSFRPGPMLSRARGLGVPVMVGHDRPPEDAAWTDADRAAATRFRRALAARLRDDAIHACLILAWPPAVPAAREAGVPAIIERVDGPSLARRVADKSSFRRIICESEAVRALLLAQRALIGLPAGRVRVIKNGIDLRRFDPTRYDLRSCRRVLGLSEQDFVVGVVARLAPEKNLGHFLEAIRLLAERTLRHSRRLRALVVGPDYGARAELLAAARRLGLRDIVRFLGARQDVPEILRALDVFVLPSLYEGTSRAVLEAMAMGLPVIVSELPALTDVIDGNGYLVPVLEPHQTWLALDQLFHDAALRLKLGRRGRALARQYDVNQMVRRYEVVVTEAVGEARLRPAFGRRLGFVADPGSHRELSALVGRLRSRRLDVHALPGQPLARHKRFDRRFRSTLSAMVRRVDPDLVVTRAPKLVPWLANILGGNELVFWPRSAVGAPTIRRAIEVADRVVFTTPGIRHSYARRWPNWNWKFATLSLPSRAPDFAARLTQILAAPRPIPPPGTIAAR